MPWYVFATPEGQVQLFAQNQQDAAVMLFERTGLNRFGTEYSEQVPGIPLLPGGAAPGDGTTIGGLDIDERGDPTAQAFRSEFRRGLDVSGQSAYASPLRQYLENLESPTFDTFRLSTALGKTSVDPGQYVNWLTPGGQFGKNLTNAAGDVWRGLQGAAVSPTSEDWLAADPGAERARAIGSVARRAAREKYGAWGASMLQDPGQIYQRYLGQERGAPGTRDRLIDFLKKAYGY